jgi:cytochrome P450
MGDQVIDGKRPSCPFDHHSAYYSKNYLAEYARIREIAPVVWTDSHGGYWVATTYATVRAALLDGETFVARPSADGTKGGIRIPRPPHAPGRPVFIPGETDGRQHDDARFALNKHFSIARVAQLEPMIDRHVKQVIRTVTEMAEFDIIDDLASPITAGVVDEHLGLGSEDPASFFKSISAVVSSASGVATTSADAEQFQSPWQVVVNVIEDRIENPRDDVISRLATETSPSFSVPDIQSMVFNIILGGADTAANLTASAMVRLDDDAAMKERLRADDSSLPRFVDEVLRMSDITMGVARTVTRDIDFGGVHMREGDRIYLPLTAANYDPAKYPHPEQLDLERGPGRHVATGAGRHFCLGANLARALVTSILREVLAQPRDYVILNGVEKNENKSTKNVFQRVPARFVVA